MSIQILPADVANQIAAGEVVERAASVVKELVENSIDAGATDIRVEVREGGQRLIRVQDNGCGIAAADTAALFHRHATSKISRAEDLNRLTTLGFRGEALASIGSVAQVSLLTRSAREDAGSLVRVAAGLSITSEPRGAPPGTMVTVEHLFANLPARLKFLKSAATEAGHILQIVTRYALAYPELRLSLVSDGKLVFQSSGSGKLYDVLVKVYGLEMGRQMLPLQTLPLATGEADESVVGPAEQYLDQLPNPVRVTGYVGAPALNRANRSYITLFVNRRWFQDSSLAYGVIQAYHTLLPVGRYPVALLFIEMDPADVDVNVHPAKAEVRFREGKRVFGTLQRTIRRTLTEQAPIPQMSAGNAPGSFAARQPSWDDLAAWSSRHDALLAAGSGHNPLSHGSAAAEDELHGSPGSPRQETQAGPDRSSGGADSVPDLPLAAPDLAAPLMPLLRVVGQLGTMYIVAEGPDGMYLIDQHAAHERILYERLYAEHAQQRLAIQPLLEPLVLDLSPEQAGVAGGALETLAEWGLEIEPFGGGSFLLRSLPAVLNAQNPQSAAAEIIDGLAQGLDVVGGTLEARLVTLICKRAAIKGGKVLRFEEMQEMVRQLEECASPRTCPHGRPTMIHVSAGELARQFGRI